MLRLLASPFWGLQGGIHCNPIRQNLLASIPLTYERRGKIFYGKGVQGFMEKGSQKRDPKNRWFQIVFYRNFVWHSWKLQICIKLKISAPSHTNRMKSLRSQFKKLSIWKQTPVQWSLSNLGFCIQSQKGPQLHLSEAIVHQQQVVACS